MSAKDCHNVVLGVVEIARGIRFLSHPPPIEEGIREILAIGESTREYRVGELLAVYRVLQSMRTHLKPTHSSMSYLGLTRALQHVESQ